MLSLVWHGDQGLSKVAWGGEQASSPEERQINKERIQFICLKESCLLRES